jgi:hypothetical protein
MEMFLLLWLASSHIPDIFDHQFCCYMPGEVSGLARARPVPLQRRGNGDTVDLISDVGSQGITLRTDEQRQGCTQ